MSGHTPGPWYAKTCRGPHNQGLIISEHAGKNIAVAYDNKDAAILAAAPELYELAKSALSELSYLRQQTETGQGDIILEMQLSEIIAKAEGR